jgi:hypothetical protein
VRWVEARFGAGCVEAADGWSAYHAWGSMVHYFAQHFADRNYHGLTAEFGTYAPVRVLGALRAENRAHHHCHPNDRTYRWAKRGLAEAFCPAGAAWRERAVAAGLEMIDGALKAGE